MTVVAALVSRQGAWMGADSLASDDDVCSTTATPKIARFGDLLLGYAGSFRVGQQFFKVAQKAHMPSLEQLLESIQPADNDFSLLAIEHGRIYEVMPDLAVIEAKKEDGVSYGAIGTGQAAALGALYIEADETSDESSLMRCLEASAEHTTNVRKPFTILGL
jgi:20S proteasome alpha/beta subunit